jgi:hypothetical protein
MHEGYQFAFLHLSTGDDPSVYWYLEEEHNPSFRQINASYSECLLLAMQSQKSTVERIRKYERVRESHFEERRRVRESLRERSVADGYIEEACTQRTVRHAYPTSVGAGTSSGRPG